MIEVKKIQFFHCGSLKNAKLVNVSKHQKVQSCFSFFAFFEKKDFEESLHCKKVFVKNDFQGKKVRLHT